MSDSDNPYASPREHDRSEPPETRDLAEPQRKRLEVGEVVVAWEKRRLWYNAVLTGVVFLSSPLIATAVFSPTSPPDALLQAFTWLFAGAIGANACYFAGPVVEGYWTWFLGPTSRLRDTLFVAGTLFAVLLTLLVLVVFLFSLSQM